MKGGSATPPSYYHFFIAKDATKLSQTDADLFHHFVANLSYLSKQERPDIKFPVFFLFATLREHAVFEYNKLTKGNEIRTRRHWTTIGAVNRQV